MISAVRRKAPRNYSASGRDGARCVGPQVPGDASEAGEVLLLENLRFHAKRRQTTPNSRAKLAALCDVYVNDAFGSAHRAHASTVGMIAFVKQAAAGLLMDKELGIPH